MDIDPNKLLAEARREAVRPKVAHYTEAMRELRAKGFTFREIAEWLRQRGLEADHNAVFRALNRNPKALTGEGAPAARARSARSGSSTPPAAASAAPDRSFPEEEDTIPL